MKTCQNDKSKIQKDNLAHRSAAYIHYCKSQSTLTDNIFSWRPKQSNNVPAITESKYWRALTARLEKFQHRWIGAHRLFIAILKHKTSNSFSAALLFLVASQFHSKSKHSTCFCVCVCVCVYVCGDTRRY